MYKLTESGVQLTQEDGTVLSIPNAEGNRHYQQFKQDVKEQGTGIVEGEDEIIPSYIELRASEYPSQTEQLDMQYWDSVNGTNEWKTLIDSIKEKYPKTITGGVSIKELPQWVKDLANG